MIVQKFRKGNRALELHRFEGTFIDDDGYRLIDEYWECRISDGRKLRFATCAIAVMFVKQNMWEEVDF